MMRTLLALVFVIGCGTNNGSYVPPDGGASLDGHIDNNPGGNGSTCATACDCQPGIGCTNGRCTAGGTSTYCCEASTCPTGNACQSSNGSLGTCQGGVNGSNGGTGGTGGIIGGSTGGIPGFDLDAGLGGLIGGLIGGLGGSGDAGIIGGLSGSSGGIIGSGGGGDGGGGGGNPICGAVPCSNDNDCMNSGLGCATCDTAAGTCL